MTSPSVIRWRFTDLRTTEQWTVPKNPDAMTSPYPTRKYVYNSTTAGANGGTIVTNEAFPDPTQWQFSGTLMTRDHFDKLVYWSRKKNRISILDHYMRLLTVTFDKFDPQPKLSGRATPGRYWLSSYTCTCTVYSITDSPSTGVPD